LEIWFFVSGKERDYSVIKSRDWCLEVRFIRVYDQSIYNGVMEARKRKFLSGTDWLLNLQAGTKF